jgi:SAM-dependent methyltransferase
MQPADLFPSIDSEIGRHRGILKGRVLNAGAGDRDISHLVDGELFNQDIPHGQHNANIHIQSPLHSIPKPDGFFDTILCNAVLEHVANPEEVMAEFSRVCRQGGSLYLAVPFLQPEHKDPTDFQRYTADGLSALVERHGFSVTSVEPLFSIYTTLGWIVWCWLESRRSARNSALKWVLYPLLRSLARTSKEQVAAAASCYRVVAVRK